MPITPEMLKEYGFWFMVGLVLLSNAGRILTYTQKLTERIVPRYAEERRLRVANDIERNKAARDAERQDRTETVLLLKETLIQYREALLGAEERAERQRRDAEARAAQHQRDLIEVVSGSAKRDAQVVEALVDVSVLLREQSTILRARDALIVRMAEKLGVFDDGEAGQST